MRASAREPEPECPEPFPPHEYGGSLRQTRKKNGRPCPYADGALYVRLNPTLPCKISMDTKNDKVSIPLNVNVPPPAWVSSAHFANKFAGLTLWIYNL
jgi:hypothetical protein